MPPCPQLRRPAGAGGNAEVITVEEVTAAVDRILELRGPYSGTRSVYVAPLERYRRIGSPLGGVSAWGRVAGGSPRPRDGDG
jgi:hypothetical protein